VFFLSIVLFIAFNVLSVIFPKYSNLFITSMFDWYVLWNVDIIPLDKLIREFLIMAGYAIMFIPQAIICLTRETYKEIL